MKVWQAPGAPGKAEWRAASSHADWSAKGGTWYKLAVPDESNLVYVVIVVRGTKGWNASKEPFYAYAHQVDLSRVTLPEAKDLLPEELKGKVPQRLGSVSDMMTSLFPDDWEKRILRATAKRGFGLVLGGRAGKTARHVRSEAKKMVELYLNGERQKEGMYDDAFTNRRWAQMREREPVEYMAGFISGMQKRNSGESETKEYLAGWKHGWEYAVGKTALPRWFTQKVPNGTEGY
jgi:hypothetical protein